jgi:hypothetical protein
MVSSLQRTASQATKTALMASVLMENANQAKTALTPSSQKAPRRALQVTQPADLRTDMMEKMEENANRATRTALIDSTRQPKPSKVVAEPEQRKIKRVFAKFHLHQIAPLLLPIPDN